MNSATCISQLASHAPKRSLLELGIVSAAGMKEVTLQMGQSLQVVLVQAGAQQCPDPMRLERRASVMVMGAEECTGRSQKADIT